MSNATRVLAQVLVLGLPMVQAMAQSTGGGSSDVGQCSAEETVRFRGLTARLENDLFAGTDRNYTNGVAFTAVSRDIAGRLRTECLPTPIRLHAEVIKFLNPGFWSDAGTIAHTQNAVAKFG